MNVKKCTGMLLITAGVAFYIIMIFTTYYKRPTVEDPFVPLFEGLVGGGTISAVGAWLLDRARKRIG